jgi:hypothetical protein
VILGMIELWVMLGVVGLVSMDEEAIEKLQQGV